MNEAHGQRLTATSVRKHRAHFTPELLAPLVACLDKPQEVRNLPAFPLSMSETPADGFWTEDYINGEDGSAIVQVFMWDVPHEQLDDARVEFLVKKTPDGRWQLDDVGHSFHIERDGDTPRFVDPDGLRARAEGCSIRDTRRHPPLGSDP